MVTYRTDRRSHTTRQTVKYRTDRRSHIRQTVAYRTDKRSHTVQDRQTVTYRTGMRGGASSGLSVPRIYILCTDWLELAPPRIPISVRRLLTTYKVIELNNFLFSCDTVHLNAVKKQILGWRRRNTIEKLDISAIISQCTSTLLLLLFPHGWWRMPKLDCGMPRTEYMAVMKSVE